MDTEVADTEQAAQLPPAPVVDPFRELIYVHNDIVGDANLSSSFGNGHWSFRWLVEQMTPVGMDPADFVEGWLQDFHATSVNGFAVSDRPGIDDFVARWPRRADGKLNLAKAPFKLRAIMNRLDVAEQEHDIGEGRFVFAAVDPQFGFPMQFTVIFEYNLPKLSANETVQQSRTAWAKLFRNVGWVKKNGKLVPREINVLFNQELVKVTDKFAARGANPTGINRSALSQVRTNEIQLGNPWSMREFHLQSNGTLRIGTVALTPDAEFNIFDPITGERSGDPRFDPETGAELPPRTDRSAELVSFLQANRSAVIAEQHKIPAAFLAGESLENAPFTNWTFEKGLVDEVLRRPFARNTCNGCHNAEEVQISGFYHVQPFDGFPATADGKDRLSDFVKNDEVPRRTAFLQHQLCGGQCATPAGMTAQQGAAFQKAAKPVRHH
ncbi:MAG: hypothetical protein H0T46_32005 [Deltaproteobacteria bacterium]|nr:hypothetical protein [Deltaproteobacteria bacterium]